MFRSAAEVKVLGRGEQFSSQQNAFLYVPRNSAALRQETDANQSGQRKRQRARFRG